MPALNEAYQDTLNRIQEACHRAQRPLNEVQLLAVSKTKPIEAIIELAQLGQRAFGENYVSEGAEKTQALEDLDLEWHFIGPIQSNKTRIIAEHFDWVHSVDREKIARRLNEQRPTHLKPLNVLIQVNLDQETQKAGCLPQDIEALAQVIEASSQLTLRGLMAIPAPREDHNEQLAIFQTLASHYHALQQNHPSVDTLSAGMSNDLEAAIEAGANLVRIGTALFGARHVS